jgi:tetratricopeptide (TPR) repeat protein
LTFPPKFRIFAVDVATTSSPPPGQFAWREIRSRYPAVRDDHLRYLEKLGLIHAAGSTRGERYYGFADLVVIKQAAAELASGVPFRQVLRTLAAARAGQLAFDFDFPGGRTGAEPARVVALDRARRASRPTAPGAADPEGSPREAPELPAEASPQARLAAKYFLEGARLDGDERQRGQAALAYRRALAVDPDLVPALVNLANLHYADDAFAEAQALYERAIRIDPECFEAYFNLGNVHHDLGRYDEALECYREAVTLNPAFPEAHFYLAVTLEKLGRSAEAKPHWRAYQELAPDGEWVELAREFSE